MLSEDKTKVIAKKTIILYILKMLQEGSSVDKPLHYSAMARTLEFVGVKCDRKTVSRNVDYLIDYGYKIVKTSKGIYLDSDFENSEVLLLIDLLRQKEKEDKTNLKGLENKLIALLDYGNAKEVKDIIMSKYRRG